MSVRIGSNISSIKAQRQLTSASSEISTVYERLSSGLRINKASDDAAGLSVLSSLNSDTRVFTQGVRNFNDGISLLNIADGTLNELTNITTRLKELAEQAANGSYGVTQRKALDAEAQALSKEYFRIERSATFNGKGIFYAEMGQLRIQGGFGLDGGIQAGLGGAIGTGSFASPSTFGISNPSKLTNGDFNSDGVQDIAILSGSDDKVSVLLGVGNGSFGTATSFAVSLGTSGQFIKSGDFNNDGILDLAIDQNSDLGIMLGNGNGTFGAVTSFNTNGAYDAGIADFNGDGALDIVLGTSGSEADVLLGRGDGTFGTMTSFSSGAGSKYLTVEDFNKDGITDFITSSESDNKFSVFIGGGDGTFRTRISYAAGTTGPEDIQTADFNNDGNLDIVINPKALGTTVSVVFGYGDGTFGTAQTYDFLGATSTALGDYNGDGFNDIAVSNVGSFVSVMLGSGNGSFQAIYSYATNGIALELTNGDFNGDGVTDLAGVSYSGDNLNFLQGNSVDGISPLLQFSLKTKADALQSLSLFDQKLSQLAQHRGKIGAYQARLSVGVNTLQTSAENYTAAAGRIKDADIAQESSKLLRLEILQKAASAVLAQANQQPALALTLLS